MKPYFEQIKVLLQSYKFFNALPALRSWRSRHTSALQRVQVPLRRQDELTNSNSAIRQKSLRQKPCTEQCQPIASTLCLTDVTYQIFSAS